MSDPDYDDFTIIDLNLVYKVIFEEILLGLEDGDIEWIKEMIREIILALDKGIGMMVDRK